MRFIWDLAMPCTAQNAMHACINLPETRLQPTAAKAWGRHLTDFAGYSHDMWRYVIWLSATMSSWPPAENSNS